MNFLTVRLFGAFLFSCFMAACGFQLRGAVELPYQHLYVSIPQNLERGAELRRQIRANQPHLLVEDIKESDAVFRELEYGTDRIIAALSAQGRAREYQLRLSYKFRMEKPTGEPLSPVHEIVLTREVTYDDNQLLAKDQEEDFLWHHMNQDLAQQILRRLSMMKPEMPEKENP